MRHSNSTLTSVAPLSVLFLTINILLFIVCIMRSGGAGDINALVLAQLGGSQREGLWDGEWIRLIAPAFLHGGLLHIVFNMMALYRLGPAAEVHFGSSNFGTLYFISGVGGICLGQAFSAPLFGSVLSIGASCAIFGIMGAQLAQAIMAVPVLRHFYRNSEVKEVAWYLALNLAFGLFGMFGRIDNFGHLGGLIFGFVTGLALESWRRQRRMGVVGLSLIGVFFVGSVVITRWPVYNPYFHVYRGAATIIENNDRAKADKHFEEARNWAKFWGKGKERICEDAIRSFERGEWKPEDFRSLRFYWDDGHIYPRRIF